MTTPTSIIYSGIGSAAHFSNQEAAAAFLSRALEEYPDNVWALEDDGGGQNGFDDATRYRVEWRGVARPSAVNGCE